MGECWEAKKIGNYCGDGWELVYLGMPIRKKNTKLQEIFDLFSDCETNNGLNTDEPEFMSKAMSFNAFQKAQYVIEIDEFLRYKQGNFNLIILDTESKSFNLMEVSYNFLYSEL